MSVANDAISRNESILDQLAYLIDELEAQRPWLMRISEVQMKGKPMDSMPSLLEMYAEMARLEWENHVPLLTHESRASARTEDISQILDQIQEGRKIIVTRLSALQTEQWEEFVREGECKRIHQFAFEMTRSDGDLLKAIAERMHESMITFKG